MKTKEKKDDNEATHREHGKSKTRKKGAKALGDLRESKRNR